MNVLDQGLPVLACCIAGCLVKYIDEVRDEDYLGGRFVRVATMLCALTILLGSLYGASRLFFLSISIGCFFGRKLDTPEFKCLALLAVAVAVSVNLLGMAHDALPAFLIWSCVAYFDERLNSLSNDLKSPFWKTIFHFKPLYLLAPATTALLFDLNIVLSLCVVGFDVGYYLIVLVKQRLKVIDPMFLADC